MLGQESKQRSFFDAAFAVEDLLEAGSFYEVLYRLGPKLWTDEDFADCYDVTTGRPSVPPSRMFKLLVLQAYEDLSDRQALERMVFDLRWKAVLGLEVQDRAVGQATLVEFRARVQLHEKMEEAFGRFLEVLLEAGVVSQEAVQLLDSTAIWGQGAVQDTYNLIGSAVRKLLGVASKRRGRRATELAGEIGLMLTAPAETGSLKGRGEIDWSDAGERRSFLNQIVGEARLLLSALSGDERDDPDVAEAMALLRRILVQDLEPVREEGKLPEDRGGGGSDNEQAILALDTEVDIRRGVAKDRVVSVGDPQMRHGRKSHNRRWDGYKAHVSVEAQHGFFTAVEVTPANVHDGKAAPSLMDQQWERGLKPVANVGDMAYSTAKLRKWAKEKGTEIVARVPPPSQRKGYFSKADFALDLEEESVTCPAGCKTMEHQSHSGGGRTFVFDGRVCADCPSRPQCTEKDPDRMRRRGEGRTIAWHALEAVLQAARAAEATPGVQELLGLRWKVEQRIAHLVRRGLRQARYRGVRKVQFQALTAALVANLMRLGSVWAQDTPFSWA